MEILGIVTFIISVIVLIVFFVMASNIAKCVELLRAIHKELKSSKSGLSNDDPLILEKAKKYDETNK